MKVSFLIPSIRPEGLKRVTECIKEHSDLDPKEYEILVDTAPGGPNQSINRLAKKAKADLLCHVSDDCIPKAGFLTEAIKAMEALPDGWGLVSFNDGMGRELACHFLAHKKVIDLLDGELLHGGYKHCYADNEITRRMKDAGRFTYCLTAFVEHDNPLLTGKPTDETYTRSTNPKMLNEDRDLYFQRCRNNFYKPLTEKRAIKVAVGIPSGDLIHADFAMCLVNLTLTSVYNGIQVAIINQKSSVIEMGRAKLVDSAKDINADYLLFLDSDMMFPPNLLVELLNQQKSENKKVICCDAVRRRAPFTQVVKDMKGKPIDYNANPQRLIEVKAGTSAVQLIDMSVFDLVKRPYFLVTWNNEEQEYLGEDFYFTQRLKKHGIPMYCDTFLSRQIVHIGNQNCKIGMAHA